MPQRTLVLGHMPRSAEVSPQRYLAAGPWCFAGQEELFPGWETRYTFAPEPFADPADLELAARQAQGLTAQGIPLLAREMRPAGIPLPDAYWDMALGCWAIMVMQPAVAQWRRAQLMAARWGHESLRVPLLPEDCLFSFATEQDFVLHGALGHAYTHWLLSRLLERMWPPTWEKVWLPPPPPEELRHSAPPPQGWKARLRAAVRDSALRMMLALPFPRVKGFSLRQGCAYSWALLRNPCTTPDQSRPLAEYAADAPTDFPLEILPLLRRSLPQSLCAARHPTSIPPAARPRLRVASIECFEDTAYRLRLARWRGAGHRLAFIQHGGNYGNIRTSSMDPMMEFAQHAFITWGWTQQTPQRGNFVPLPHGQLARLRHAHKDTAGTLLYVGTEITVFPYRMDSRPTPLQYVQYRDDKQWFFEALGRDIRLHSLYRPYFTVPGTLEDAPWLLPRFPDVRLCAGPLDAHMLRCRLLVLDHHGTTLALALAAHVPTVLFWDRAAWGLCPETEALLDELAAAGIWHPTAESAAMHIYHIWGDVAAWWESAPVRAARERWSAAYALTVEGPIDTLWTKKLKTL